MDFWTFMENNVGYGLLILFSVVFLVLFVSYVLLSRREEGVKQQRHLTEATLRKQRFGVENLAAVVKLASEERKNLTAFTKLENTRADALKRNVDSLEKLRALGHKKMPSWDGGVGPNGLYEDKNKDKEE